MPQRQSPKRVIVIDETESCFFGNSNAVKMLLGTWGIRMTSHNQTLNSWSFLCIGARREGETAMAALAP